MFDIYKVEQPLNDFVSLRLHCLMASLKEIANKGKKMIAITLRVSKPIVLYLE